MWKYKCGHKSEGIIMDSNILSMNVYMNWSETVGLDGDMSICFECYCRDMEYDRIIKEL